MNALKATSANQSQSEFKKELLTVAKVKFGPSQLSRETLNFACDVLYNGKKVGDAYNDGNGGSTFAHGVFQERELFEKLAKYFKSLPPIPYTDFGGGELAQSIDTYIDDLINDIFNQKEIEKMKKKITKKFATMIVFGDKAKFDAGTMDSYFEWNLGNPIERVVKNPANIDAIKNGIKTRLEKWKKEGLTVLNDNLEQYLGKL